MLIAANKSAKYLIIFRPEVEERIEKNSPETVGTIQDPSTPKDDTPSYAPTRYDDVYSYSDSGDDEVDGQVAESPPNLVSRNGHINVMSILVDDGDFDVNQHLDRSAVKINDTHPRDHMPGDRAGRTSI